MKAGDSLLFGLVLALCLAWVAQAQTDDVDEVTIESFSLEVDRGKAEREIFAKSIDEISLRYIRQWIGEEKTEKSRSVIDRKILAQSGKYILFMKGGRAVQETKGYRMPVTLRISKSNLRTLLQESALLYKNDTAPKVLPLVAFIDRVHGQSHIWWLPGEGGAPLFLRKQAKNFHETLHQALWDSGFYLVKPVPGLSHFEIPLAFQQENYRSEDYSLLSDHFKTQIVVAGQIRILASARSPETVQIDSRLTAVHAVTQRVIGEVSRVVDVGNGPFDDVVAKQLQETFRNLSEDLSVQILQTWQKGVLGSNSLQISIKGMLNPMQVEAFKAEIISKFTAIKVVRERLFEPEQIIFEVDSSASAGELLAKFKSTPLSSLRLRWSSVDGSNQALVADLQ